MCRYLPIVHPDGGSTARDRSASHVHRVPVVGVGAQLCPCDIATSTPQTFPVVDTINAYITTWNHDAKPFAWTATPGEITRVKILHRDFKKLLANNTK